MIGDIIQMCKKSFITFTKMKFGLLITLGMLVISITGCDKLSSEEMQDRILYEGITLTKAQEEMTSGVNDFAFRLYAESFKDENMFISPFSVSLALSMLATGAVGETEAEFTKVLGFEGKQSDEMSSYYKFMCDALKSCDKEIVLELANSMWPNMEYDIYESYVSECEKYFSAHVQPLDFSNPSSVDVINDWVKQTTHGTIDKILDALVPHQRLVLVNSLYFKATWPFKFQKKGSKKMTSRLETTYLKNELCHGVALPYGSGNYEMDILVPESGLGLSDVVEGMTGEKWSSLSRGMGYYDVSVEMPKFSFTYDTELVEALKSMGLSSAFAHGDYSKITDSGLFVDKVYHKTYVDVDEKGTEASAVTVVGIYSSSGSGQQYDQAPHRIDFKVDKPFLFVIRERSTGAIIFIGQYTDL